MISDLGQRRFAPLSSWDSKWSHGGFVLQRPVLLALQLCCNKLNGSIPEELGQLSQLNLLVLQHNELNGTIPASLGNLTNLKHLDAFQASTGAMEALLSPTYWGSKDSPSASVKASKLLFYSVVGDAASDVVKPLIWVEAQIERHSTSRVEYAVKARSQFKERSAATNVEIDLPLPADATTPTVHAFMVYSAYAPEKEALV